MLIMLEKAREQKLGGYINLVGKLAIAHVVLAKTIDTVMTQANETHGFPKPIFDELNCLVWGWQ